MRACHHSVVFSVPAALLAIALSTIMGLSAKTGVLLPVLATAFVAQVMIAAAPAPADDRGRALPTPHMIPTMIAAIVSSAIAYHPWFLMGAGTRASLDALQAGVFAGVVPGVAAGLVAAIVAQVARRDGRRSLVRSLAAATSLMVFAACASAWIGAARAATGTDVVVVSCAAVAVAVVIGQIPGPRPVVVVAALLIGAGAAAATAYLLHAAMPVAFSTAAGAAAAGIALLGLAVGSAWTHGRHHLPTAWGLPAALGLALSGPAVFVAGDFLSALR
jgi:hypothetical protein